MFVIDYTVKAEGLRIFCEHARNKSPCSAKKLATFSLRTSQKASESGAKNCSAAVSRNLEATLSTMLFETMFFEIKKDYIFKFLSNDTFRLMINGISH